jgi:diguanylate cyclase (GGDEF) domain protein
LIIGIGAYNILGLFEISSLVLLLAMMFILIQMTSLISTYAKVMQENEKTEKYKALVSYDNLTLMGSRHSFEEHINNLKNSPKDTTFISADLNNLKLINDNLGHNYGDVAIIEVGRFLQENFKDSKIYRIGGDEYVVIFEGTIEQSYIDLIREKKIYIKDISEKVDVTVSIGYFSFYVNNMENYSIDDALRFSDIHMYENKRIFKEKNNAYIKK